VKFSNGKKTTAWSQTIPEPFQLNDWDLIAEQWEAPEDITDSSLPTIKRNTTHKIKGPMAWKDVKELEDASGVGYYTTSFEWPLPGSHATKGANGAYFSISTIRHALRVRINDHSVPPLDFYNAVADITPYLQQGTNTVTIIVPTTWWNYIRTVLEDLKVAGASPLLLILNGGQISDKDETGLVGNVTITPVRKITV
jgi:hypothetical protein